MKQFASQANIFTRVQNQKFYALDPQQNNVIIS